MTACCSRWARPDEVYLHPTNLFVAKFRRLPGDEHQRGPHRWKRRYPLSGARASFNFPDGALANLRGTAADLTLGVRPEAVLLKHQQTEGYIRSANNQYRTPGQP